MVWVYLTRTEKNKAEGGSHYFLALVGSIASPCYSVYSFFFLEKNGIWNQIVLVKRSHSACPVVQYMLAEAARDWK